MEVDGGACEDDHDTKEALSRREAVTHTFPSTPPRLASPRPGQVGISFCSYLMAKEGAQGITKPRQVAPHRLRR